jgi:hypothetical protein
VEMGRRRGRGAIYVGSMGVSGNLYQINVSCAHVDAYAKIVAISRARETSPVSRITPNIATRPHKKAPTLAGRRFVLSWYAAQDERIVAEMCRTDNEADGCISDSSVISDYQSESVAKSSRQAASPTFQYMPQADLDSACG